MKRLIIAALALATIPAMAVPTGTLLLKGQINTVLDIVVTPVVGVNDGLDLTTTQTNLNVASVNEVSNSDTGYKIMVKSNNAGELKNGTLDQVPYTLSYDGGAAISQLS